MSISFVHLRRILFGTSCAIVFGFGASQALAAPVQAALYGCTVWEAQECDAYCMGYGPHVRGRCTNFGVYDCSCYPTIPMEP